ncbi:unnamed protein product [Boreogadus saida]
MELPFPSSHTKPKRQIHYRNVKNINMDALALDLQHLSSGSTDSLSVSDSVDLYNQSLSSLLDLHAPLTSSPVAVGWRSDGVFTWPLVHLLLRSGVPWSLVDGPDSLHEPVDTAACTGLLVPHIIPSTSPQQFVEGEETGPHAVATACGQRTDTGMHFSNYTGTHRVPAIFPRDRPTFPSGEVSPTEQRDHLQFIFTQEMVIMSALSTQIPVPQAVMDAFVELHRLVSFRNPTQRIVRMEMGNAGRPRFIIDRDHVIELLEMGQNVTCIARLFGVSRWTMSDERC